ncbi:MICOS complex subunit [Mycena sanguinolenta]|uniref:MICOS complex subunit n=1 Tax=Mycena sanguinolenta TaxID=230812 RepID=A0A8H6Z5L4_9AGAR|nr:MICOS complex subunit [Mycena sanguinolenta]
MQRDPQQKLSIYAPPQTDILLEETPSALEEHIGTARRALTGTYRDAHSQVQGVVSQWIGVEYRVENRIKALLPPDERLVPGTLYAAVGFLSGAILARHRSLTLRFLLPPPPRRRCLRAFPAQDIRERPCKHEIGKAHAAMTWARVRDGTASVRESVRGGVMAAVVRLQDVTGLRIGEALGVVKEMEKKAERVVEEKLEDVVAKTENKTDEPKLV